LVITIEICFALHSLLIMIRLYSDAKNNQQQLRYTITTKVSQEIFDKKQKQIVLL